MEKDIQLLRLAPGHLGDLTEMRETVGRRGGRGGGKPRVEQWRKEGLISGPTIQRAEDSMRRCPKVLRTCSRATDGWHEGRS